MIAVLLVAVALVLRIAYVDATPDYVLRHDAVDYDVHARSIAQGEGFSKTLAHGRPTAFRPPGYPYFLGAVYHVFKADREPASPSACGSRGSPRPSWARRSSRWWACSRAQLWGSVARRWWRSAWRRSTCPLILVGGAVMSEPLFDVFMLASLAAVLAHRRSPHRYRWALLAGVMGGLAALTRAQALILLAPLALAVWDGRPWRGRAALGPPVVLVLAALLTITPWTIRNARELHAFVPISTQFGSALAGTYNDAARADTQNPASWQGLRHVPDYAYLFNRVGATNEAVLEQQAARARRCTTSASTPPMWRRSPGGTRAGCSTSAACAARAPPRPPSPSTTTGPIAGCCASGSSPRSRSPGRSPRWPAARRGTSGRSRVLSFLSVVFLVVETPRYRTPIDPFLVLLATAALVTGARYAPRLRRQRPPALAGRR